jgi:hypothetical protein
MEQGERIEKHASDKGESAESSTTLISVCTEPVEV